MILLENPLRLSYKFIRFEIDNDTIKEFELMARARKVRTSIVNKLKRIIINGNHFDSPLIINATENKKRIIDGQHRIKAISEIIQEKPEFKIFVLLIVYTDLTNADEKKIFEKWNSGTRQSGEDFIQIYTDEMPAFDYLSEKGIVSVYNEPERFKFRNLVQPYIQAQAGNIMQYIDPQQFIDEVKKLKEEDFKAIEKYANEFKNNLGMGKENKFIKSTPFYALLFVYFTNECPDFWVKFKKIKDSKEIGSLLDISGRIGANLIRCKLEEKMFGKKPKKASELIKREFVNPFKIWTDEKIEFLRKNYEKTMLTIEDLQEKVMNEYHIEVSIGSLKEKLVSNKIRKYPEWKEKIRQKEEDEGTYQGRVKFTKKVMEFIKKCSETMTKKETFEKTKIEFQTFFSYDSFNSKCSKDGIKFVTKDALFAKCREKELEIIKKNLRLDPNEVRDKIIEKTGKYLPTRIVSRIIERLQANQNEEAMLEEGEEDEEHLDEDTIDLEEIEEE
jgi:hypothetical protein